MMTWLAAAVPRAGAVAQRAHGLIGRVRALVSIPPATSNEDMRGPVRIGVATLVFVFGVMGSWLVIAPLTGAVVASAVVKVDGNRKSVQHLDGGIVRSLPVRENDRVSAGDVLLRLDDTQARAEVEVLAQQFAVLRVTEARLLAELERRPAVRFPDELTSQEGDAYVRALMDGQRQQFETRRTALDGQRLVLGQRIAQFEEQITGSRGVESSLRQQIGSVKAEIESIRSLVERGLIARPRFLQLERNVQALEGQIAENLANRARTEQSIGEMRQQILQVENERLAEVTRDLRDTQARLLEVIPRLHNARAVLARTDVRAPYGGQVVGLAVFGAGAVVGRGERILDIVPDQTSLIVDAQIPVDEIAEVRPNMAAEVHFTAFRQRTIPRIRGVVLTVSADRLTDQRTGAAYYSAQVRVNAADMAEVPQIVLYPGMPVTVMIPTVERTAADYLFGPLVQSFNRSLRER